MALVFSSRPVALGAALAAAVAAVVTIDRRALGAVVRLGGVVAVLFSSAVVGAVAASVSDWRSGLELASAMLVRLLVLMLLTALLARNVDTERLLQMTRRLRMDRLGLILGLALNVLPHLMEAVRQVTMAWRVRRRSGRSPPPLAAIELLLAHVARIADEAAAAAALRGHSALLGPPVQIRAATRVIVATGPPGSGKSTAVLSIADRARRAGWRVSGFVQPGRFEDGSKTGFSIHDLGDGSEVELARLVPRHEGQYGTRFVFSHRGFAAAKRALARVRRGDLLVVDELGPLELRGQGHMKAVRRAFAASQLRGVVVVVRQQLVPALLAALRVDDAVVIDVTVAGGEEALGEALGIPPA